MIAVVKQAVNDYEQALLMLYFNDSEKNRKAVEELEEWFENNDELYCYKKADVIMQLARERVAERLK